MAVNSVQQSTPVYTQSLRQRPQGHTTTVESGDTFQASSSEWKPYKPYMNGASTVQQAPVVDDDETIQVNSAEVGVKKPASNSSREVRDQVLRKLGYTKQDIEAYKERYPEGKDGLPKDNGFYIGHNGEKRWASEQEVAGWPTDSKGNTPIEVEGSSLDHLKKFRDERMSANVGRFSSSITDEQTRKQFGSSFQTLVNGDPEARQEAYRQLTAEQDPVKKQQIAASLEKLANEGGYGDNAWVRLAQANYADKQGKDLIGPGLEEQRIAPAQKLTEEALRLGQQGNGPKMSREEAALFYQQAAGNFAQTGDKGGQRKAEMMARFNSLTEAERNQATRFDGMANENNYFQRGFIDRLPPAPEGVSSMSAPTDAQQKLDRFNQDPRNQMGTDKKDLAEDPWKETYPGRPRLDNRNLRVGGGVGFLEEVNKWGQTYGKMQQASRIIQERDQLQREAKNSNQYAVPPKPSELPQFRAQLEQAYGKEGAAERMADIEAASRAFWNQ